MSYKCIAMYLDDSQRNKECLEFVIHFAVAQGAHLTGLYVVPDAYQRYTRYTDDRRLQVEEQHLSEARHASQANFEEIARKAGLLYEWHTLHKNPLSLAVLHSRVIDLGIIVQKDVQSPDNAFQENLRSTVLLEGGKPVLFLPCGGRLPKQFETVAIAWNGSRECSRAVAEALPLLVVAKKVMVLIANTRKTARFKEDIPGTDIASYLSRHSIKVDIEESTIDEESVADWIIAQAIACNAELLVSGAFGHSRFYKFVWGDITQRLFDMATLPLFMAN